MTHAEGADVASKNKHLLDGTNYCNVNAELLTRQQLRISQHAEYFHWRLQEGGKVPIHTPRQRFNSTSPDAPSAQVLERLRRQYVPWPLLEHWERYPFYWGHGTLDMYSRQR